ncbi:hypothetical protein SAMN04488051_10678 [Alkalimonas amylolytica]|uniref:Uncharacterized protein n=2 Tax=Alkalimonas amylolytica TaxID=152573 RepID=A0A1H4DXK3_ALKAM|nr:hypothetical protein [Alkalimonas amylolytica]SEA77090.1 hypothetical protein SAMN04488051_10678 [Alkalimonas amylolytica]
MMKDSTEQPHFWQVSGQNQTYTELCNALYERELLRLSQCPASDVVQLPRQLASLPFYIRKAAQRILKVQSPLLLDSQNASWFASQAVSCPLNRQRPDQIARFFEKAAKPGLLVPVYQERLGVERILLDAIDEVDLAGQRLHCNQHGWFAFAGTPLSTDNTDKFLLQPVKVVMTACCCGHQWSNQKRSSPRALSLRELLLTTDLNWKNFAKPILRAPLATS